MSIAQIYLFTFILTIIGHFQPKGLTLSNKNNPSTTLINHVI
jgi:hypothetical protein